METYEVEFGNAFLPHFTQTFKCCFYWPNHFNSLVKHIPHSNILIPIQVVEPIPIIYKILPTLILIPHWSIGDSNYDSKKKLNHDTSKVYQRELDLHRLFRVSNRANSTRMNNQA